MVFNATFHKISVIDLIKITGLVWIKIYKTLNQFLECLKRYNDLIFKNKMILHHAYKYIFPFHKCMWINIEHVLPWFIIRSTRMSYSIYKKSC
jgi:hypothetical protein